MKSNKKKKNKFDELVDALIQEFIKIPHLDITQHDETAKSAFNRITFRIAELASYRELVCSHFIPATNKVIFNEKQLILHSEYGSYLNIKDLDFKETLFDTIRLAYVGLFHKIENFINDLIAVIDTVYQPVIPSSQNIAQWAKANYKIDFKDWQTFSIIFKINWVCNCVKHKDGYPVKEPKPFELSHLNPNERIRITTEQFKMDCDLLMKLYPLIIQVMMSLGLFRYSLSICEEPSELPEIQKIRNDTQRQIEDKIREFTKALEELRA